MKVYSFLVVCCLANDLPPPEKNLAILPDLFDVRINFCEQFFYFKTFDLMDFQQSQSNKKEEPVTQNPINQQLALEAIDTQLQKLVYNRLYNALLGSIAE